MRGNAYTKSILGEIIPRIVRSTIVELPQRLNGINEENFSLLMRWEQQSPSLRSLMRQVTEAVLQKSQYNRSNRPDGLTTERISAGSVHLTITTTPNNGRISYADVYNDFDAYLKFLRGQYGDGVSRKGIRSVNGEPYIELTVAVKELEKAIEEARKQSGSGGVMQRILISTGSPLITPDIPEVMDVMIGSRNYRAVVESNVVAYHEAEKMLKEGTKRVADFKGLVLEDTLGQLGRWPEDVARVAYPFEHWTFEHQVEPRVSPKYAETIDELLKGVPEQIRRGGKIGDLVVLSRAEDESFMALLGSKGIIDQKFFEDYLPRVIYGRLFISLKGLQKRLSGYKAKHDNPSLEQNFFLDMTRLQRET